MFQVRFEDRRRRAFEIGNALVVVCRQILFLPDMSQQIRVFTVRPGFECESNKIETTCGGCGNRRDATEVEIVVAESVEDPWNQIVEAVIDNDHVGIHREHVGEHTMKTFGCRRTYESCINDFNLFRWMNVAQLLFEEVGISFVIVLVDAVRRGTTKGHDPIGVRSFFAALLPCREIQAN